MLSRCITHVPLTSAKEAAPTKCPRRSRTLLNGAWSDPIFSRGLLRKTTSCIYLSSPWTFASTIHDPGKYAFLFIGNYSWFLLIEFWFQTTFKTSAGCGKFHRGCPQVCLAAAAKGHQKRLQRTIMERVSRPEATRHPSECRNQKMSRVEIVWVSFIFFCLIRWFSDSNRYI